MMNIFVVDANGQHERLDLAKHTEPVNVNVAPAGNVNVAPAGMSIDVMVKWAREKGYELPNFAHFKNDVELFDKRAGVLGCAKEFFQRNPGAPYKDVVTFHALQRRSMVPFWNTKKTHQEKLKILVDGEKRGFKTGGNVRGFLQYKLKIQPGFDAHPGKYSDLPPFSFTAKKVVAAAPVSDPMDLDMPTITMPIRPIPVQQVANQKAARDAALVEALIATYGTPQAAAKFLHTIQKDRERREKLGRDMIIRDLFDSILRNGGAVLVRFVRGYERQLQLFGKENDTDQKVVCAMHKLGVNNPFKLRHAAWKLMDLKKEMEKQRKPLRRLQTKKDLANSFFKVYEHELVRLAVMLQITGLINLYSEDWRNGRDELVDFDPADKIEEIEDLEGDWEFVSEKRKALKAMAEKEGATPAQIKDFEDRFDGEGDWMVGDDPEESTGFGAAMKGWKDCMDGKLPPHYGWTANCDLPMDDEF